VNDRPVPGDKVNTGLSLPFDTPLNSITNIHMLGPIGCYYMECLCISDEHKRAIQNMFQWIYEIRAHALSRESMNRAAANWQEIGQQNMTILEYLFPRHFMTINFHLLQHICKLVLYYGPIYTIWMAVFERLAHMIKVLNTAKVNIEETVCRALALKEYIEFTRSYDELVQLNQAPKIMQAETVIDYDAKDRKIVKFQSLHAFKEKTKNNKAKRKAEFKKAWNVDESKEINAWLMDNDKVRSVFHKAMKEEYIRQNQPTKWKTEDAFTNWLPSQALLAKINQENGWSYTMEDVKKITYGPLENQYEYSAITINGVKFRTAHHDLYTKSTKSFCSYVQGKNNSSAVSSSSISSSSSSSLSSHNILESSSPSSSSTSSSSSSKSDYCVWRIPQIKSTLKILGLPQTGNKEALVRGHIEIEIYLYIYIYIYIYG
jgi:hypothetical protein